MTERLLLPLDQSPPSEAAIPLVADLARGDGATVRLLHVTPVPNSRVSSEGRVVAYADQEMARLEAESLDYLQSVEVGLAGAPTECVVRFGDAVKEILEADAFGADLIVMSTVGRSAVSRAVLGSVAQQVFRKAEVPVVLFHADREARRVEPDSGE